MTKSRFIVASLFLAFALCAFAQGESPAKEHKFVPRFNLRVGLGGVLLDADHTGFTDNIGAYVEMPMSKKHPGWKVNLGLRLDNVNMLVDAGHYYSGVNDKSSHSWYYGVRELFLEVPVIFSYDFHIAPQGDLRLGFGLFYSRYITGDVKISATGEKFAAHSGIMSTVNEDYNHGPFVYNYHSGGVILELGYYFKDFYFGAEYDMTYGMWVDQCHGWGLNAIVGYRF